MTLSTKGYQISSWTDSSTSSVYENAWIYINSINYSINEYCRIFVDIYSSQQAFLSGMIAIKSDIFSQNICYYGDIHWNTYFDKSVISQANKCLDTAALAYVQEILGL